MRTTPARACLAIAFLVSAGQLVQAAPRGPAFGNNRYRTAILNARGDADVDDYVAALVVGERLTVTVSADRKSDLLPEVTLLGPDGREVSTPPRVRKGGRSVSYKKVAIDATGEWTVRVAGADLTEGAYTVAFKVKPPGKLRWKKQLLGGTAPLTRSHAIPAVDGALVDISLTWRGSDTPVELRSLRDPAGAEVPGPGGAVVAAAVRKKTKALLKRAELVEGDGEYALDVGIDAGTARYTLTAKVTPTGRPSGRRVVELVANEPYLGARAEPVRGVAGQSVRFTGGHFSEDTPPVVLFGDVPGTSVSVTAGGASLHVVPPAGVDGTTVGIAVVNPDGQADERPAYFLYAPPPELSDLVRGDGSAVRGGPTDGGQALRVQGVNLHPEQTVFFGGSIATQTIGQPLPGELDILTPARGAGLVDVVVADPYGRSSTATFRYEYKVPPSFDEQPYDPPFGGSSESVPVTATGDGFSASDVLLLDGGELAVTVMDAQTIRFTVPALELGDHDVRIRDRVGTVVVAPVFTVKGPPVIAAATPVGGSYTGTDGVPLSGGAVVEVTGSSFHALDTVMLGGDEVEVLDRSFGVFRFVSPEGGVGLMDLEVIDAADQSALLPDALRRLGYADSTASRVPAGSAVDDLSAWRGAIGDLDGDAAVDDIAIVSYGYAFGNVNRGNRTPTSGTVNSPGSRGERTRLLIGGTDGVLADGTSTRIPAEDSDPSGADDWNGHAVAIGDLDSGNGQELVVGGVSPDYRSYNDVRIFRNDGSGGFALETTEPLPATYLPAFYAYDETGAQHLVFTPRYVQGLPTALALGDLDDDGDLDVVVGRDWYDLTYEYVESDYVDVSTSPPYVYSGDAYNYISYTYYYYSATQIFVNGLSDSEGWSDGSAALLPSAGNSNVNIVPGLLARDLVLGDVDGRNGLDIVLTWDDPTTVSPYGLYSGSDQARVATRILLNDGNGDFSGPSTLGSGDVTAQWLPAASGNEFWQAHRVVLADLDNDGTSSSPDLDLVLLHEQSIDAHTGTTTFTSPALRILRNDGVTQSGTVLGFVDVTAAALPALPTDSNDNWRGGALTVTDVDGDGFLDIIVGTREVLRDDSGTRIRSTRLLLGEPGLRFRRADDFLPPVSVDSGEADDLLVGDLAGTGRPVLLRLTERTPDESPRDDHLRAADWVR